MTAPNTGKLDPMAFTRVPDQFVGGTVEVVVFHDRVEWTRGGNFPMTITLTLADAVAVAGVITRAAPLAPEYAPPTL